MENVEKNLGIMTDILYQLGCLDGSKYVRVADVIYVAVTLFTDEKYILQDLKALKDMSDTLERLYKRCKHCAAELEYVYDIKE